MKKTFWYRPLVVMGLLLAVLAFAGCSGDDGDDGKNGKSAYQIAVDNGFEGTEEEWLNSFQTEFAPKTNESCNVCHGEGQIIGLSIDSLHPLVDPKIEIADIVVASAAGAADTVTFKALDEDGAAVTGLTLDNFRFYVADIVPAGTATATQGTWETAQPERWIYERSGSDRAGNPYPNGSFAENGGGSYTYTFAVDLALGDLARAPEFDITHNQRLMITSAGTDDLEREAAIADFVIPADGANTGVLSQDEADLTRAMVVQTACTNCHGDPLQSAAHGSKLPEPTGLRCLPLADRG